MIERLKRTSRKTALFPDEGLVAAARPLFSSRRDAYVSGNL